MKMICDTNDVMSSEWNIYINDINIYIYKTVNILPCWNIDVLFPNVVEAKHKMLDYIAT